MTGAQQSQRLVMAWLILDLTDSVGQLGLVVFAMGVPVSVISLWGGVLADRLDRRLMLMASQAVMALNLLVLAALTFSALIEPWHVYVSSFGLGLTQALTMPARNALIRNLVSPEDINSAVGLNAIQAQSAQVVWPSIAGAIISFLGIAMALTATAVLAFAGIVFLLSVRPAADDFPRAPSSQLHDLSEGVAYCLSTPRVRNVLIMSIVASFLAMPYVFLAPGFAREVFGFTAGGAGLLLMATGIGAIAGSSYALMVAFRDNLHAYFLGSAFLGVAVAAVAATPYALLCFGPAAVFGICLGTMIVSGQTLFQSEVPHQLLGRVNSIWSLSGGLGLLASLPVGLAGDLVGIRLALATVGLCLTLFTLAFGLGITSVLRLKKSASTVTQSLSD
jgi:MFS family permease